MLVDTHAHLYLPRFDADRDAVLARAREADVGLVLQPAIDAASAVRALSLADADPRLRVMVGVHPTSVHEVGDGERDRIEALVSRPGVVGIGETGLDYYWSREHVAAQQESLRWHARLAIRTGLPLVLHNRDKRGEDGCSRDLIEILRDEYGPPVEGAARGVFHCFSGPAWLAPKILELGFHIGLGGTLTFKNGGVAEAIADVPMDRIVLETDAPYLAPTPFRGTRNEPAHVRVVAERLAEIRGLTLDEVARATTQNAVTLFGLPSGPEEAGGSGS